MIPIAKPIIGAEEKRAVLEVLESGQLAQGPKVAAFETKLASICGVKEAIAVNSGTAALHTALLSLGIGAGDEVITTPFTFVATANAILMTGATPVFADITLDTYSLDPAQVKKAITQKTKAILAVDLYGHPYDVDAMQALAEEHSLTIIEDACQALGATYKGRPAGSLGSISALSFYATKNITTGEGGMILTDDPTLAKKARRIRQQGERQRYDYECLGYNYRLTDVAASIGLAQLTHLNEWTERRRELAAQYSRELANTSLILPQEARDCRHCFHQYTIRTPQRAAVIKRLTEEGIGTAIFYPTPLYCFPHLKGQYAKEEFPNTERAAREVLSLPVHPGVTAQEVGRIVQVLKEVLT